MEEVKKQEVESLFCPYEQALELKKLDFDEPCLATYNSDKKVSRNPSHDIEDLSIEGQPYYWQNSKIHINCVTAPLYQQAFRWFREKYGLNYVVVKAESWFYTINGCNTQEGFKTYEEAELECLRKLIEIVKKKDQ